MAVKKIFFIASTKNSQQVLEYTEAKYKWTAAAN